MLKKLPIALFLAVSPVNENQLVTMPPDTIPFKIIFIVPKNQNTKVGENKTKYFLKYFFKISVGHLVKYHKI